MNVFSYCHKAVISLERLLSARIGAGGNAQHRSPVGLGECSIACPAQLQQEKAQGLLSSGTSRAVMASASPEGMTASWDTPERDTQGWSQSWEPGAGSVPESGDDCP